MERIPDDLENLNLASSIIISNIPEDATAALNRYTQADTAKVAIRFKAVGRAPILKQQVYKITSGQRFQTVTTFLRRQLKLRPSDTLFLYINSTFAPSLDEVIGNLYQSFKVNDELVVNYCTTQAFG
ncbi:APG12-domain-containing protein [Saitoella complicata NRRL Y-17804]|uniref:APG12-domain-containing protein n=1 Tax=Saitoella complicata (strain BCRC 22490 / CBS 7301 / JCM 7358 / NBRC 10748 / NRRL Y-17804) TaxID=698492 RepID=UPI0008677F5A|nr:APG12-domain-containing protein [Saitoella complicata NRRL Y-17804]ODQ53901.1 APG12-domain-containing protein [Saitoella complicata NRRL Y-17804]